MKYFQNTDLNHQNVEFKGPLTSHKTAKDKFTQACARPYVESLSRKMLQFTA